MIRGAGAGPLLMALVRSGRCYWESGERPLEFGPARELAFAWKEERGSFRLQPAFDGEYLDGSVCLVRCDPPFYIDCRSGAAGEARVPFPPSVLPLLLGAPPVPMEETAEVCRALAQLLSPEIVPPPYLEQVLLEAVDPIPLLHIRRDGELGTLAQLRMDYGGRELFLLPEKDAARWAGDKTVFEVPRNLALERAAAECLRGAGLKQLARERDLCYAFPTRYHQGRELDDTPQWMQLAAELFPELERRGWRISWGGDLDFTLLRADDWEAEVEEGGGSGWFDLSLGIRVGNERLDLRPLLPALIEAVPSPAALAERWSPLVVPAGTGAMCICPASCCIR